MSGLQLVGFFLVMLGWFALLVSSGPPDDGRANRIAQQKETIESQSRTYDMQRLTIDTQQRTIELQRQSIELLEGRH